MSRLKHQFLISRNCFIFCLRYNLRIWVNGAAHCAEYATTDNEIDMEKANECRRCWAQVGDWATDAGYEKGNECKSCNNTTIYTMYPTGATCSVIKAEV